MTGRICYRGKVTARAQRVSSSARSNQVGEDSLILSSTGHKPVVLMTGSQVNLFCKYPAGHGSICLDADKSVVIKATLEAGVYACRSSKRLLRSHHHLMTVSGLKGQPRLVQLCICVVSATSHSPPVCLEHLPQVLYDVHQAPESASRLDINSTKCRACRLQCTTICVNNVDLRLTAYTHDCATPVLAPDCRNALD